MGWRATFWAIAILCVPAAFGIIRSIANEAGHTAINATSPRLRGEVSQLVTPRLILAMVLGALINGGTFAAFTVLVPVAAATAGLTDGWVPVVLVMFGIGSFLGVTIAGRLSDQQPGLVRAVGGPLLLTGWIVMALVASHPVALILLVLVQGFLSFGVGSTLITRVLYAASGAPTMGGSYATAALNIGAAAGPVFGAFGLAIGLGLLAPVWVPAALTAIALVIMLLTGRALTTIPAEATR